MRFSTLLLTLSTTLLASAQITIDQGDMPHAGDELLRTTAANNPFLNYNATGPAHVWDFGGLVAGAQNEQEFFSVNSTNVIYALAYADVFFNSNRANHATDGVDIPFSDLLQIEDPYTFFYRSGSTYKKVGYGADLAGIPIPITLSQHDVIYELPLNYGNTSTSASSYQISVPNLAHYGYQQTRTNTVDGWGVITTPAGSFDVLRVKTTIAGRDTINVDTLSLGFAIERPLLTEYKWLAHGYRVPILQITTNRILGLEVITEVTYYDEPRTLAITPPFGPQLCPGATLQVPYTATGTFNQAGFLVQANVFRAQLSDANGSFGSPTVIGSVTSTTSGTINATIPSNLPMGNGYRIRVVATNPAITGTDNGVDLTIGSAPMALVEAIGPATVCAGNTVMLQANDVTGHTYQWTVDGEELTGATNAFLDVSASGNYAVDVTNSCGTTTSAQVTVTINALPQHAVPASAATCAGTAVNVAAENLSGQADLTYVWTLNGEVLDGVNAATVDVTEAGDLQLLITNDQTGCSYSTSVIQVSVEALPTADLTAAGDVMFCAGGSVLLSTPAVADATYSWYLDGEPINGAENEAFNADASGTYTVSITSATGCTSLPSAGIAVQVEALPMQPEIAATGATTVCAGGSVELNVTDQPGTMIQWYLDGEPIAGAETGTLQATASGAYSVVLMNDAGCTAASSELAVNVLDAPEVPVIMQTGDVLFVTEPGTYQWYLEGVAIDGATEAELAVNENGNYTVLVTDANGCSVLSEPRFYLTTGLAAADRTIGLFPNPASTHTTLVSNTPLGNISLHDGTGRLVSTERATGTQHIISVEGMPPGVYTIRTEAMTVRLVVE